LFLLAECDGLDSWRVSNVSDEVERVRIRCRPYATLLR